MSRADFAFRTAMTAIVVPVFGYFWIRGAMIGARQRLNLARARAAKLKREALSFNLGERQ